MNRKSTYYIRVLAGGYLVYLGYSLVRATLREHLTMIYLAFGIVFAILGLIIGGSALLSMCQIDREERENSENQQAQEEAGENLLTQKDSESLPVQEDVNEEEDIPGQGDGRVTDKEEETV